MISVMTMVGALRMVHEVYGYKLGKNIKVSQIKGPVTFTLWRNWWYSLCTENSALYQQALHLLHEVPLSTEAHR